MKNQKQYKKAIQIIAIIVSIAFIVITLNFFIHPVETMEQPLVNEHLFVDATYLLKTDETNNSVNVSCTLYLTNLWEKESGIIKATVYVIEDVNNLAVYKNNVSIGEIGGDSTAEIEIPVILSNSSYKIEILIFENEKLIIKGVVTISAYPIYVWDEITHSQRQEWTVSNTAQKFENIRLYR